MGKLVGSGVWVVPKTWQNRRSYLNGKSKTGLFCIPVIKFAVQGQVSSAGSVSRGLNVGVSTPVVCKKVFCIWGFRVLEFGLELESEQISL